MIREGLTDHVRRAADAVAEAMEVALRPLADVVYGVEIRRTALVTRGTEKRVEPGTAGNKRVVRYLHPLDAIAEETGDDVYAHLDEVAAFFAERAHAELDRLQATLGGMVNAGNAAQRERMDDWELCNPWYFQARVRSIFERHGSAAIGLAVHDGGGIREWEITTESIREGSHP